MARSHQWYPGGRLIDLQLEGHRSPDAFVAARVGTLTIPFTDLEDQIGCAIENSLH